MRENFVCFLLVKEVWQFYYSNVNMHAIIHEYYSLMGTNLNIIIMYIYIHICVMPNTRKQEESTWYAWVLFIYLQLIYMIRWETIFICKEKKKCFTLLNQIKYFLLMSNNFFSFYGVNFIHIDI